MLIIPAIQEVEIRRIKDGSHPGQKVSKTPISTNKAGCRGRGLSFWLCGRHKWENLGPSRLAWAKTQDSIKKKKKKNLKQKRHGSRNRAPA
jgi:hypothetical protein